MAQAIEAEENARRRLAFALHDDVVQELMVASRELRRIERGDANALDEVRGALDRSLVQLRGHLRELSPPSADGTSTVEALSALTRGLRDRTSIDVHTTLDVRADGHHTRLVVTLARELLSNVERHADAAVAWVALRPAQKGVLLEVGDDGRGIHAQRLQEARAGGHLGLAAARERVEAIGGSVQILTVPGAGTLVTVRLPVRGPFARLRAAAQRRRAADDSRTTQPITASVNGTGRVGTSSRDSANARADVASRPSLSRESSTTLASGTDGMRRSR